LEAREDARWKITMIRLTRLNSHVLVINADLIKFIENAPDTVLTLTNGEKIVVRENADEVVAKVIAFRRAVIAGLTCVVSDANCTLAATKALEEGKHPNQAIEGYSRG
jgi:flagellar protein FlbD